MGKNRSRRDLLSDLPLGIIHIILSLVPIRDAVKTSLLSRQWRYIWSSLPCLTFDDTFVGPPIQNESDQKKMIHFISQAPLLHKGPIHKFKLSLSFMKEYQCVDQWLLFLSRNDIRILVLKNYDYHCLYKPHSSLYSCQNLTHLELRVYSIPPLPPSFKGFMFLRSFYINVNELPPGTIESIVTLSPLLEKLELVGYGGSEMKIRAPNLKYFHFFYPFPRLSLCAPQLEDFIGDFSLTKTFSIEAGCLVFHHLRTIKLCHAPFGRTKVTPNIIRLITGSPNLCKLKILATCFGMDNNPKHDSVFSWDTKCAPDLTYDSLKVIEMEDCCGELNEMKLLKFLLARSPVLEKMTYKPHPSLPDLELMKLMSELLRCRRASVNAEILICKKWNRSS